MIVVNGSEYEDHCKKLWGITMDMISYPPDLVQWLPWKYLKSSLIFSLCQRHAAEHLSHENGIKHFDIENEEYTRAEWNYTITLSTSWKVLIPSKTWFSFCKKQSIFSKLSLLCKVFDWYSIQCYVHSNMMKPFRLGCFTWKLNINLVMQRSFSVTVQVLVRIQAEKLG